MAELEKKLHYMEKIVERSNIANELDFFTEKAIIEYKRSYLINSIRDAIKLVIADGERTKKTYYLRDDEIIVHSMYQYWTRGGIPRGGYLSFTMRENPLGINIINQKKFLREYDNQQKRIIYLKEFTERCEKLLSAIEEGKLDDLFGTPPFEILHQINGRHGELLSKLDIDPLQSKIYRIRKAKIIKIVENG